MKSFKSFISESSSIYNFLIWEPEGELKAIADAIDKLKSSKSEVYRGISEGEVKALKKDGYVVSKGEGNTRDIRASYVADNIHLAGRFALVDQRDRGKGFILVLDRKKLPDMIRRDPGNYSVSQIPKSAVKKIIDLSALV